MPGGSSRGGAKEDEHPTHTHPTPHTHAHTHEYLEHLVEDVVVALPVPLLDQPDLLQQVSDAKSGEAGGGVAGSTARQV